MLFTRVRIKYRSTTFDCTNFFSLSMTNQENYHNANKEDKAEILVKLFRSSLFGMEQMTFDTYVDPEKSALAATWYKQSELIVLNKEEDNIVY